MKYVYNYFQLGYSNTLLVFQRAEALVKKWDSLQVKEKEEKYTRLLQRLELQQKLIAKNDLLYKHLEKETEEKHMKVYSYTVPQFIMSVSLIRQELQSRRDFKRQMMQELRDHNKRGGHIHVCSVHVYHIMII